MSDFVFVFDPALDRPIPVPDAAPASVAAAMAAAPIESLRTAVATARETRAAAIVLFGRVLDPHRASPSQAAVLRSLIAECAADGCHTVWVTDDTAGCDDISRMLGEPRGLLFATPFAPVHLDIRGMPVEILCGRGDPMATASAMASQPQSAGGDPITRRLIVDWDTSLWSSERWDDTAGSSPRALAGWLQPGCHCVWGSRRSLSLPAGVRHVAPLQPRFAHEPMAGGCSVLSLTDFDDAAVDEAAAGAGRWRTVPTQRVAWKTLTVESAAGGDEELATVIWSALESFPADPRRTMQIVRCCVECGTSVARRVRVAEIAAETLARVRDLLDQKASHTWCEAVVAATGESLAPLGHARSGGRPGMTTSFSSALADIVVGIEAGRPGDELPNALSMPADMAREAGWLALELIESA